MRTVVKRAGTAKGRLSPAAGTTTPIELPDGMWERIRQQAYDLWEQRGCQDGNNLRDWLDAEDIVMEEIHEARE